MVRDSPVNSCPALITGCGQESELLQPKKITAPEFSLKHKISLSSHINMSQKQGKPKGVGASRFPQTKPSIVSKRQEKQPWTSKTLGFID